MSDTFKKEVVLRPVFSTVVAGAIVYTLTADPYITLSASVAFLLADAYAGYSYRLPLIRKSEALDFVFSGMEDMIFDFDAAEAPPKDVPYRMDGVDYGANGKGLEMAAPEAHL